MRWFLHRASHHGPEHLAFESLMSLEAKAAIKHRQNDLAREYIKILDNNDIQGKERTRAAVNTYASSSSVIVNVVQKVQKDTRGSKTGGSWRGQKVDTDQCLMPDGTRKTAYVGSPRAR